MKTAKKTNDVKPATPALSIDKLREQIWGVLGENWSDKGINKEIQEVEKRRRELEAQRATLERDEAHVRGKLEKVLAAMTSPQLRAVLDSKPYDDALRAMLGRLELKEHDWKTGRKVPRAGLAAWTELKKSGASDDQIKRNLRGLKRRYGESPGSGGFFLDVNGSNVTLYEGARYGSREATKLLGLEQLVKEARRILQIPQPVKKAPPLAKTKPAAKKPAPAAAAKPTAKKKTPASAQPPQWSRGYLKPRHFTKRVKTLPPLPKPVEMKAYESIDDVPWHEDTEKPAGEDLERSMQRAHIYPQAWAERYNRGLKAGDAVQEHLAAEHFGAIGESQKKPAASVSAHGGAEILTIDGLSDGDAITLKLAQSPDGLWRAGHSIDLGAFGNVAPVGADMPGLESKAYAVRAQAHVVLNALKKAREKLKPNGSPQRQKLSVAIAAVERFIAEDPACQLGAAAARPARDEDRNGRHDAEAEEDEEFAALGRR